MNLNASASLQLRKVRLRHPLFEEAFDGVINVIKNALNTERPNSGILIHGPGGTGKSTLLEALTEAIETGTNGAPKGRVLNITFADSVPSPKSFYESVLQASNYVLKINSRSIRDGILEDRVVEQMLREEYLLLCLDESQQVIKNSKDELRTRLLDAIKNVSTRTKVTTILSGTRDISLLFDGSISDGQLSTRFATRYYLSEFTSDIALRGFLNGYVDQCTLLDINIVRDKYKEIFQAVGGNLRRLTDFLIMSVEFAESQSSQMLTQDHLRAGFKSYFGNAHARQNPF